MQQGVQIAEAKGRGWSLRVVTGPLAGILVLGFLAACTVDVAPPPESDPPLVQDSLEPPPPPAQPTEPQAWSRDLDFDGGEDRVRRSDLAQGLVAGEQTHEYSGEQLTYRSAGFARGKPTEAELVRERARQRLEAARPASPGAAQVAPPQVAPPQVAPPQVAPPQVVAAPVEPVTAEALPAPGSASAADASDNTGAEEPRQTAGLPDDGAEAARSGEETVAKLSGQQAPHGKSESPVIESWDPPEGTILVQVSAIQERRQIAAEWERLKKGYPSVMGPLRLVVEEAKLGERGVFFRVQAGGFGSQEEAEAACVRLTGQGQPCFVLEKTAGG